LLDIDHASLFGYKGQIIMLKLVLHDVSLDYPVYDTKSRSLRRSITQSLPVGGRIKKEKGKRTSILALDNVSLSFEEGDRVALFGHNGAGKTSLLKVLAGFYEPTSGAIEREGKVSALLNLMSGMDVNLNGYENILLCGMLYGLSRKGALARIDDIAEFSELGEYLNMPVRLLSSGMILRLAFSICTSIDCEILLLDEWVGAGDQAFIEKTKNRLSEMVFRSSIMVFATHNPIVAKQLCNKAIYMEHGRVTLVGDIDQVIHRYHTPVTES
jgi:ABC-type polysaccharide/polyol phosphate transport system ATPase subunit